MRADANTLLDRNLWFLVARTILAQIRNIRKIRRRVGYLRRTRFEYLCAEIRDPKQVSGRPAPHRTVKSHRNLCLDHKYSKTPESNRIDSKFCVDSHMWCQNRAGNPQSPMPPISNWVRLGIPGGQGRSKATIEIHTNSDSGHPKFGQHRSHRPSNVSLANQVGKSIYSWKSKVTKLAFVFEPVQWKFLNAHPHLLVNWTFCLMHCAWTYTMLFFYISRLCRVATESRDAHIELHWSGS